MKWKLLITALSFSGMVFLAAALTGWVKKPVPVDRNIIARSAGKGLRLLERSDYIFSRKGHCVSCHHNILTAVAAEIARKKAVPVTDSLCIQWRMGILGGINAVANDNKIYDFITAKYIGAYFLFGLQAQKYPADFTTDLAVNYLMGQAKPDGSFGSEAMRVPLESGEIHLAALSVRDILEYAPPAKEKQVKELVNSTRHLFETANPDNQQEIAFQLMGLEWTGGSAGKKSEVAGKLISLQRADGGWSQLPAISSDAYATGQALYALSLSGLVKPEDDVYQKGIRYLLNTQDDSGAWIVITRASPIQPFFTCDFPPYDENQFISAAGSNWAVIALLNALPDKRDL